MATVHHLLDRSEVDDDDVADDASAVPGHVVFVGLFLILAMLSAWITVGPEMAGVVAIGGALVGQLFLRKATTAKAG
jgi:hypothetical protein